MWESLTFKSYTYLSFFETTFIDVVIGCCLSFYYQRWYSVPSIFIVEDELSILKLYELLLTHFGFDVVGTARNGEIAVRAALGADRGRLMRQLLTESALLALVGAVIGVLLARWGAGLVGALIPEDLYRVGTPSLDLNVLAFSIAITLLTILVFGLAPAFSATAMLMDASVKNEKGRFLLSIHLVIAGRISCFSFLLFPMKLSSTMKTPLRQPRLYNASSSLSSWSLSFVLGTRPLSKTMSQNSQSKGQPREYWTLMEEYLFMSTSSHAGIGVAFIAGHCSEV